MNQPHRVFEPGRPVPVPAFAALVHQDGRVDTLPGGGVVDFYASKRLSVYIDIPLGRATLGAAGRGVVFVANNQDGRVTVFDTAGAQRATFELKLQRRRVSRDQWRLAVRDRIDGHPFARMRARLDSVAEEIEPICEFPALAEIHGDALDRFWVRTFDNYGTAIATWIVVDSTGRPVRAVALPAHFQPIEIGADYLLGVLRDADGVERVALYPLPNT